METLKPVEVSEYYINRVAVGINRYFWDNLFKPIFAILKDKSVYNSKDDVINAIKTGKIWYEKGAFRTQGRFSNGVAKTLEEMGAKFKYNAYYIAENAIPLEYANIIALTASQAAAKADAINQFLSAYLLSKTEMKSYIESAVDLMFRKLELDILQSAKEKQLPIIELGIATPKVTLPKEQTKNLENYWKKQDKRAKELQKAIMKATGDDSTALKQELKTLQQEALKNAPKVEVTIDDVQLDAQSKKIAQDYTYNMEFWVRKWEAKNITLMRQDILKMIQEGARVPRIREYFEKRWNVAKSKAQFLAVNESHLAGSVIKATNYQMMGCNSFKWGRSSSKEKRILHEHYYGKVFNIDNPPIIDEELGITGLPRQIWNCKCHMLIVPPTVEELIKQKTEIQNAKRNIFKKIFNSTQCDNNAWRYRRFGKGQTL